MYENKNILILGLARSGFEVCKLLSKYNNNITVNDMNTEVDKDTLKELEDLGIKVVLGTHPDELINQNIDYLIKNPGITNKHKYVLKAIELGIPVINEIEVSYHFLKDKVKFISITGSNGKTTTTTIVHEIFTRAGMPIHLTGNIGYPLSSFVDKVKKDDIILLEISSHQLANIKEFKSDISVMTNLSKVHIDFFDTYENYKSIKKRVFNHQTKDNIAIINKDNEDVMNECSDINSNIIYFSTKSITNGCYLKDNSIYYKDEEIISIDDIKLKGIHSIENDMVAIIISKLYNIDNKYIKEVLENFGGVEHRLEIVDIINGITFINDSKSTNNISTITALKSFNTRVQLILGGLNRGQDFSELYEYMNHVVNVVCYGENKLYIKEFCDKYNINCIVCDNLEDSTKKAYEISENGDIILLSPASASWDQFKDFEARGKKFKETINVLKEGK